MSVVDRLIDLTTPDAHETLLGRNGRIGLLALGLVLALLAPVFKVFEPFYLNVLTRVFIFALFALSFDFAFGHGGLASFGHAAMFGSAGYAVAFLLTGLTNNVLAGVAVAMLTGFVVGAFLAWLSARAREIYFAFLTLAFAQMFYVVAINDVPAIVLDADSITNADNGIVALPSYELFGLVSFYPTIHYYYLALLALALSVVILVRVANSPFGRVMLSIRENEDRVAFLGYDVRRYKIVGFAISGAFAGLAGGLFIPFQSLVHPQFLYWTTSGEVFLMTLLGGMGTLWGPMVGAALVVVLEDFENWKLVLGSVYVVVVIFAPEGLAGILKSLSDDPVGTVDRARAAVRNYVRKVRG